MTELQVTTLDYVKALLLSSFYGPLQESKSGMEMPKVPVVSRSFVAYLASFVAVDPSPFFRAKDECVQTGTVKFFDKALSKLAGMKDTALSAYLHPTAWYKRFPPIHSPDRAEDPKTPEVDGGNGSGGRLSSKPIIFFSPTKFAFSPTLLLFRQVGSLFRQSLRSQVSGSPLESRPSHRTASFCLRNL